MDKTFTISRSEDSPVTVKALSYDVKDGVLTLRSGSDLVASFAPGKWTDVSVKPEEE